jgi:ElaB/YqjD/DUF883 family membrane-anchored ribosome-binding protein
VGKAFAELDITKETADMEHTASEFNRAKGKMADDLKMIVSDGEDLLKAAASASGEGFTARAKFSEKIVSAKAKLADLSQPVVEKAGQANDYVHGSPWTAIGVAVAAGMLIGFLAARRSTIA